MINGTKILHNVSTCLAVRVNTIDGSQNELLLQVAEPHNVFLGFLRFDLLISGDDS